MICANMDELVSKVKKEREGKIVVLATGTFDLFHVDHLEYLKGAKRQGDILVVAVKSNQCAALKNPERPIISEEQRIQIVDAIKCVDYSIIVDYDSEVELDIEADNQTQKEWLIIFQEIFECLKPDVLYYENNSVLQTARDRAFEKYKITGVPKTRGKNTSTTKIVEMMKK